MGNHKAAGVFSERRRSSCSSYICSHFPLDNKLKDINRYWIMFTNQNGTESYLFLTNCSLGLHMMCYEVYQLTHCPIGDLAWVLMLNFQMHCCDFFHKHFQCHSLDVNGDRPIWWEKSIMVQVSVQFLRQPIGLRPVNLLSGLQLKKHVGPAGRQLLYLLCWDECPTTVDGCFHYKDKMVVIAVLVKCHLSIETDPSSFDKAIF